jgi:hypothetical protein
MFKLKDLQAAKEQTAGKVNENSEKSDLLFSEAVIFFEQFQEKAEKETLKSAIKKLTEALKYNSNNGQAYFLLALVYYMVDDTNMLFKYLKLAEEAEPDLPGIKEMKQFLSSSR